MAEVVVLVETASGGLVTCKLWQEVGALRVETWQRGSINLVMLTLALMWTQTVRLTAAEWREWWLESSCVPRSQGRHISVFEVVTALLEKLHCLSHMWSRCRCPPSSVAFHNNRTMAFYMNNNRTNLFAWFPRRRFPRKSHIVQLMVLILRGMYVDFAEYVC